MAKYKFNDSDFTEEELKKIAESKGYTLDELFEKNPDINKIDPDPEDEGKTPPSQEITSATVEEDIALEPTVTDSKPVTISSDLPEVKTGTVADTEYTAPTITSEESEKIIDDFNKVSNVDAEFENKKATAEKINRFKKDQFKTAEKEEYNLYKQTGEIQPVVLEKSDIDQKISNNRRDFMEDIAQDKRVQLLNQEVQLRDSLTNATDELKLKINDNVNAINNIFVQYEESIKQNVPYSVDEYNIAKQKSQELMKSTKQMESDLLKDYAILNKKNEFIDSFKRSYGNIDQLENVLKTTATDMALGLAVPLDMLKSEEGKEKSYTKDLLNYRQKLQKESAEGLPKAIPVESISSFKDLVNWGSDSFVNFVPSGVMAFTGPAAPYLFGASGFGSRIAQFELESLEAFNLNSQISSDSSDIKGCNIFIITVPTPINKDKTPNLEPVINSSKLIGSLLSKGSIVIYESTVYPGVTDDICMPVLERESAFIFNKDFSTGYSPERIVPGDKVYTIEKIKKVVSASNPSALNVISFLYSSIIEAGIHKAPSIKVAEASKVTENIQRDVNIALINEFAIIFNKLGLNSKEILDAAATKWNFLSFTPGLVGGHCIGVDPYYLTYKSKQLGYEPKVILAGRNTNDNMSSYVAHSVINLMCEKNIKVINFLIKISTICT